VDRFFHDGLSSGPKIAVNLKSTATIHMANRSRCQVAQLAQLLGGITKARKAQCPDEWLERWGLRCLRDLYPLRVRGPTEDVREIVACNSNQGRVSIVASDN